MKFRAAIFFIVITITGCERANEGLRAPASYTEGLYRPPPSLTPGDLPQELSFEERVFDGFFVDDQKKVEAFDRLVEAYPKSRLLRDFQGLIDSLEELNKEKGGIFFAPDIQTKVNNFFILQRRGVITAFKSFIGEAETTLGQLPKKEKIKLMTTLEGIVKPTLMTFDYMGETIADKIKLDDPIYEKVVKTIVKEYFSNIDPRIKKRMVLKAIQHRVVKSEREILGIMFNSSGPVMQKFYQILAKESTIDPDLGELLGLIEDQVEEVPFEKVHRELRRRIPQVYPFRIKAINYKALGTGSMSQNHLAKMRINGEERELLVRLIKPEAVDDIQAEREAFLKIAKKIDDDPEFQGTRYNNFRDIIVSLIDRVEAEANVISTANNQKMGKIKYSGSKKIKGPKGQGDLKLIVDVPEVIYPEASKQGILFQARASGTKLSKLENLTGFERQELVKFISEKWISESILGDGFFHADLHEGNFLVSRLDDGSIKASLIDFGMVGKLKASDREALIKLNIGIQDKNRRLITTSLKDLIGTHDSKSMNRAVDDVLKLSHPSADEAIRTVRTHGFKVSDDILDFGKVMVQLSLLMKEVGLETNADGLLTEMVMKGLPKSLPRDLYARFKEKFIPKSKRKAWEKVDSVHLTKTFIQSKLNLCLRKATRGLLGQGKKVPASRP